MSVRRIEDRFGLAWKSRKSQTAEQQNSETQRRPIEKYNAIHLEFKNEDSLRPVWSVWRGADENQRCNRMQAIPHNLTTAHHTLGAHDGKEEDKEHSTQMCVYHGDLCTERAQICVS